MLSATGMTSNAVAIATVTYVPLLHITPIMIGTYTAEKLSDCLKFQKHAILISEVFLCFRVLLLKLSPSHLMPFWPAMLTELVRGSVTHTNTVQGVHSVSPLLL